MADQTPREKFQPALLDRLVDDDPKSAAWGGPDDASRQRIGLRALREAVIRDLGWLLNASCPLSDEEAEEHPRAASSVLNFGLPDLTGARSTGLTPAQLEAMVVEAVARFEPRLTPGSLKVRVVPGMGRGGHRSTHVVEFEVDGEICPLPLPESLHLRTQFDLATGRCEIRE